MGVGEFSIGNVSLGAVSELIKHDADSTDAWRTHEPGVNTEVTKAQQRVTEQKHTLRDLQLNLRDLRVNSAVHDLSVSSVRSVSCFGSKLFHFHSQNSFVIEGSMSLSVSTHGVEDCVDNLLRVTRPMLLYDRFQSLSSELLACRAESVGDTVTEEDEQVARLCVDCDLVIAGFFEEAQW